MKCNQCSHNGCSGRRLLRFLCRCFDRWSFNDSCCEASAGRRSSFAAFFSSRAVLFIQKGRYFIRKATTVFFSCALKFDLSAELSYVQKQKKLGLVVDSCRTHSEKNVNSCDSLLIWRSVISWFKFFWNTRYFGTEKNLQCKYYYSLLALSLKISLILVLFRSIYMISGG